MRRLELFAASALLALSPLLQAETQVQVVGLFPNAAVLLVDGQRKLVKAGQTGPGGVRVLSADSKGALLEVDGVQRSYGLSREYNQAGSAAPQKTQVSISKGVGNHYWIAGSIDGHPVQFMVDTGATLVALGQAEADRLGLPWRGGERTLTQTANGPVAVHRVSLDRVRVGEVELNNIAAVVVPAAMPYVLLGNSFLSRFQLARDSDVLRLELKR